LPQEPQFSLSDAKFLQTPLQSLGVSPVHRHCPLTQTFPPAHLRPQAPQWLESVLRSAHPPLQGFCPLGQLSRQFPPEQSFPEAHGLPQPPQWRLSEAKFLQIPLQSSGSSAGHSQTPLLQNFPPAHLVVQFPQKLVSILVLTQEPLQSVGVDSGQDVTHFPRAQRCPVGQT